MEIEENTAEVLPADETSSETVSTDQIVRDEELTETELVNRVILQLQYNEDMQAERDAALQETLDQILASVSSNDLPEDESDGVEDVVKVVDDPFPLSARNTISMNDVKLITSSLSELVSETVSQNDISNDSIMSKHLTDYSVSESLLAFMFFGIFILCVLAVKRG